MTRPAVSVIVPFRGTAAEAERLTRALAALDRVSGDEVIVVDNSPETVAGDAPGVEVVTARRLASSYYARNVGAERAANDWILFLDHDTAPPRDLLDTYFAEPLPDECGIVAGEVAGAADQTALTARHARARQHLGVSANLLRHGPYPAAGTANLLVRKEAWAELGGFHEVRSGADLEFCWRAHEVGWRFAHRPRARVEHLHTEALGATLRKAARYGPGQSWSDRRYPGSGPRPRLLRELARALAGVLVWPLTLQFERAAFKALDGAWAVAFARGYYLGDNRAAPLDEERPADPAEGLVLRAEAFPDAEEPESVDRALERAAQDGIGGVKAMRRPRRVARRGLALRIAWFEDLSPAARLAVALRFALRHPARALRARRDGGGTARAAWRSGANLP